MMRPRSRDHALADKQEWREWGLALGESTIQILLLLCTGCLVSWVIVSNPSQNETLSSRLEYRVGTVAGDFSIEWQQQLQQRSSNDEYVNSTALGDPLQAAGTFPLELGRAPSPAGLAVADGFQGICPIRGLAARAPASVCNLLVAWAQTGGSAAQLPATAVAEGAAPQDQDATLVHQVGGADTQSAQAGLAQQSAADQQQLGGQQGVLTSDPGSEHAEHPAHASTEPAPGASVQQQTTAELDSAAPTAAADGAEPAAEISTALHKTHESHSTDVLGTDSSADLRTGLQEEDVGTEVSTEGMQDSHAGALCTVQEASTPELQAPAAALSMGLLEPCAVRPFANFTGKLGAYSAQLWGLVVGQKSARAAAGAGAEQSIVCELHQGLLEAHSPAEAAGVCGPVQQDSTGAYAVDGVQEQGKDYGQQGQQELQEHQAYQALPHQEQHEQPEVAPLGLHSSDLPAGAFVTPGMMYKAYQRTGPWYMVLYAVCALAVSMALRSFCNLVIDKLFQKRRGLACLPDSIKRDPKAVEAFFALRDLFFKQNAWWQLVGVSAVAVCQAEGARQQAETIANRLEGGAGFARELLRQQARRMQRDQTTLVDELRAAFDEQLAERDAAHAAVVEQHLQKQAQQQLTIVEQSEDRAKLGAEVRQNYEALAAKEAIISRLESDLARAEQGKQQLQRDFDQFLQRSARGEGFAAALELKVDEGAKREQALNSKVESAQKQLSEANSTITQLRAEVQHKQEFVAARDASCRQLEESRQQLQQDKEQLQQQLLVLTHERDDARSQAAALQEGKEQLQQLSSDLQQEVTSLQALHGQQKQQLQEQQGACDVLQQQSQQLRADLAAAGEREAALTSKLQEQQQALDEQGQRAQDLQAQLDSQRNQHDQTRIKLQHEVVQRQTAEESLRHERAEKQAAVAKADGLQLQLTSTTQELSLLKAEHVAATQTLQRVQEDFAELSQQHKDAQALITSNEQQITSLQERLAQRDRQLSVQDKQLSDDHKQIQQLQQQLAELQQQAAQHIAEAERQAMDRDQLIAENQEERQKLADSRSRLQAAEIEVDRARERCAALQEQVEEQQQNIDQLRQECEFQQAQLAALRDELEQRKRALDVAQRDLNEALEKYDYEDSKNRELGAENGKLQRTVLNLEEHERQLTEELEECNEQFEQVAATHAELQAQYDALKEQSGALVDRQAALLDENTARTAELQEKLREVEADMVALTRERDDLEKKLYFAEMARDQTQQAKALAAEDAVKARQALTEEKLRKTVARTMSTPSGRGAVAASVAGGEVSSSRPWQRINSSVPAKKWGTVEPAYLHQHYKDPKDGTIRRCGSPTRSVSNSESTPGTPRSTATSGDGGSTQRGRRLLASTPSNASAAVQQLEGAFDEADTDAAAAANSPRARSLSSEGSHHGSLASARLRRVSTVSGSPRSRLQECSSHQQEQLEAHVQAQQQEQQQQQGQDGESMLQRSNSAGNSTGTASPSPGRTVAAAAAGLRSNFTDAGGSVAGSPAPVAAATAEGAAAGSAEAAVPAAEQSAQMQDKPQQQDATTFLGSGSPETQQQQQQQQQQQVPECSPGPASTATATATPPLEQGGNSPSLCSNGTKSRLSLADMRDMRPLALSPVQQSSDLVLTGLDADSPGVTSSLVTSLSRLAAASLAGASILDAVAPVAGAGRAGSSAPAVSASLTLAAITPAAAAVGSGDGGFVSVPSAVSAPATPAAAAATGAGDGAADGLQFFTPLATAHSSGSSSSVAECSSPVFAAAAVAHAEPATPYFTPTHGGTAAAATADSAASDMAVGNSAVPAEAAVGDVEESAADAAGQPSSSTAGAEPAAPAAAVAAAGDGGDVVDSNADGNPPLAPRVSDGASHYNHTSSFVPQVDDADVVLIGSLSEADFVGLGLAGSQHDLQQQQLQDLPAAGEVQAAGMPSMQQQQQQGVQEEQGTAAQLDAAACNSSLAASGRASSAGSKDSATVAAGSTRSSIEQGAPNGRAAAVPRLPLFQLHAAAASASAAGAGAGLAANSSRASAGVPDWELDSDELSEVDTASSGSSSGEPAPTADDDCADAGGDSCQEDTAAVSDLESTPPKMFIGNMPPAAAVATAAAVGVSGGMHSPRTVQHSPRYHDQRAMHSPRYLNQQLQQHSPRYLNQQQQQQQAEQEAVAAAADAEGSESGSDDLAGDPSMPDAAPRSKPSSPAAAAAAGAANMRSSKNSKSLRSSQGSPGTSPQRPTSAGAAGNSPPSAGAAAGSGALKYLRRSSRLSDPASSSCSSIKSLVAQSRQQQQQQQQQLRRTGSNNSIGTAAVAAGFMSVLDAGAGAGSPRGAVRRSGSLDQQGLGKVFSLKQQQPQQGRSRRGSAGNSPTRSCIAAVAASKSPGAAAAAAAASGGGGSGDLATMQVLRSSRGSDDSVNCGSQDQQHRRQLYSPAGTCSPQPCTSSLAGFSTPPGPFIRPAKAATVGPPGMHGQQRSTVMWKSLDDFVRHNQAPASHSTHSSPGNRQAGGVGSSSVGLPPFLSPPAAVLANPWASPAAAAAQGLPGLPPSGSARASYSLSPQGSVGGRLGSPAFMTPLPPTAAGTAARVSREGSAGSMVGVPVLPVAEGVCEGASDADSPNSCISGDLTADGSPEEGRADSWTVQENPVYFDLQ